MPRKKLADLVKELDIVQRGRPKVEIAALVKTLSDTGYLVTDAPAPVPKKPPARALVLWRITPVRAPEPNPPSAAELTCYRATLAYLCRVNPPPLAQWPRRVLNRAVAKLQARERRTAKARLMVLWYERQRLKRREKTQHTN